MEIGVRLISENKQYREGGGIGLGFRRHHCGWNYRIMKVSESPKKVSRVKVKVSDSATPWTV